MGLACALVVLLQQCRRILCLHLVIVLSLWCFCRESLLLLRFLMVGRMLVRICSIFPLGMESKALVKSTNSNVACRALPVRLQGFYGWLIFVTSWIYFFGSHFGFSKGYCRFWVLCGFVVGHCKFKLITIKKLSFNIGINILNILDN